MIIIIGLHEPPEFAPKIILELSLIIYRSHISGATRERQISEKQKNQRNIRTLNYPMIRVFEMWREVCGGVFYASLYEQTARDSEHTVYNPAINRFGKKIQLKLKRA